MSDLNSLSKLTYPLDILGCPVTEEEKNRYENAATKEAGYAMLETFKSLRRAEVAKVPEPTVADSIAATLAQRGSRYGDFTDHAKIAQSLQDVMRGDALAIEGDKTTGYIETNWDDLDPVKKQALTVIADKIARILSGDPNYDDNWHDIQGYAKLVEDRLPKSGSTN